MDKVKLMIVDSDTAFTETLCRFLKNYPDIEIVGCESNGREGMQKIRRLHPDAVLFDLLLPEIDGISLLRSVNEQPHPPAMICCTRFYSDVALEAMRNYGAAYLMFKPIELHSLRPAIVSCANLHRKMKRLKRHFDEEEMTGNQKIRNYIVSLGIPTKLIGCSYLAEAVRLAQADITLTRNLSKGLYLEISRIMNTTPTRIERSIRTAISIAFQNGGMEGKMITCPSNKEFINYVLRTIDL